MPLHLVSVDEHSPAQRLGLEPGCTLLAIDGNPLNDALDYQFYTSAPHFTLTICQNGAQQQISVEKGEYEPFGCNFKTYLVMKSTVVLTIACFVLLTSCPLVCGNRFTLRMTMNVFPFVWQLYHDDQPDGP